MQHNYRKNVAIASNNLEVIITARVKENISTEKVYVISKQTLAKYVLHTKPSNDCQLLFMVHLSAARIHRFRHDNGGCRELRSVEFDTLSEVNELL
jgi:hypothetical protein